MYYYEVLVGSQKFHGKEPLTYASDEQLFIGCPVIIPLQNDATIGIVVSTSSKPRFATKTIIRSLQNSPVPPENIQLLQWLRAYYPAPLGLTTQLFAPTTLTQQSRSNLNIAGTTAEPLPPAPPRLPALTDEQLQATQAILTGNATSYLVHGNTGTGKTRLYLEIIRDALQKNRSALLLTPEIGLTPQLATDFSRTFPGQTVIVHSNLTAAERREAWLRIASTTRPLVVIGPRSALFSPLHSIGTIIIDEAHESAYKQEQAPHYLASRVAAKLATLHKAKLILGTATPLITDYYTFQAKSLPILRLTELATASDHASPSIEIINLREREHFSASPWISSALIQSVKASLNNGTQSLLFLNRRGTARLVLCQSCGWQANCPKCDLPLTYHADSHNLRCHTCGHQATTPAGCPSCASTDIIFKSIGTKTIVQELERLFPKARIRRFDSDSAKSERLEEHYHAIRSGAIDIIVGTQMLAKGLDLPKLSTVGVIIADTSLYFPDYTAEERTYQMLTQVIGRVGRGHQAANIIIQTYHPDSPTINDAITKNYDDFYQRQISERAQFLFPPFCHVLKLSISRANRASAQKAAQALRAKIVANKLALDINGPAPAFSEKAGGRYRWQIVLKARRRDVLLEVISTLPSGWNYDIDPMDLL